MSFEVRRPRLTLEEQVGQVILGVCSGDAGRLAGQVALGRLGGVVWPAAAICSAAGLAATLDGLQRLASYPLLCAGEPGLEVPGEAALGGARRPDLARRAGALAGALARSRGLHLVLGPSLDVQRAAAPPAGRRSFGENASLAASLGSAFVEGCQASGALAAAGLFPGGGGATYDERGLATLPQDRLTLEKIDLLPYVEAQRAGLGAIRSGHLHVAALDNLPNRLATHSSAVIEGLLRGTLRFQGLLLSGNLDAPEVKARYEPGQAAVLAFAAGHDLLVTESPEEVYRALYEVLLHGDVPAARLEEALGRIWAAKGWLGLAEERFVEAAPEAPEDAGALAREVARAALTAVRGWPGLAGGRMAVLASHVLRPDGTAVEADLHTLVAGHLAEATLHTLQARPAAAQLEEALTAAEAAQAALLFLDLSPGEGGLSGAGEALVALAQALKRAGLPVGVVVVGDPYALARFPEADLLLYLPDDNWACLEAAFAYLLGQCDAPGRLPVTVPGLEG